MEVNPYQAPHVEPARAALTAADGALRRDGNVLLSPVKATFPPRCVKCNEPIERPHLRRKLSWHHPLVFATLLLNLFIYLIVALVVRHQATIYVGLCERHWSIRRRDLAIAWGLVLLAIAFFVVGILGLESKFAAPSVALLIASPFVLLSAALWAIARCSVIRPKRIDRRTAWIRGVCPEFLAQVEHESLLL